MASKAVLFLVKSYRLSASMIPLNFLIARCFRRKCHRGRTVADSRKATPEKWDVLRREFLSASFLNLNNNSEGKGLKSSQHRVTRPHGGGTRCVTNTVMC